MINKEKVTIQMSLKDYETMQNAINFYRRLFENATDIKYINVKTIDYEDGILEIEFKANEWIRENIEHFDEDFEGFGGNVTKIILT